MGGKLEEVRNIGKLEAFHPAGADAQLPCGEHHMGTDDAGIHFSGMVALIEGAMPRLIDIIADHENGRGAEDAVADGIDLLQRLFALQQIDPPGLIILCGGREFRGLQYQIKLLFLYLLVGKAAYGKTILD